MSGRLGKARIMLENARTFYFLSFDFQLIFHSVRLHHGKMDKPMKSTNKKTKQKNEKNQEKKKANIANETVLKYILQL